jgi:hypothetical protein
VLSFEQDDYVIFPGETVSLEVRLVRLVTESEDLFSYGVRLTHGAAGTLSVIGITVPAPLDFYFFGAGALIDLDLIGAKGNIDVADVNTPYADELIVTFDLSFDTLGEFELGLDFFNTNGPNEEIFLDGDGNVIDDTISFGATTVRVVDESQVLQDVTIERSGVTGADIDLRFDTIEGLAYTAQTSINLMDWDDLATTEGDGDEFFFRHLDGGTAERRFYRVVATTDGS